MMAQRGLFINLFVSDNFDNLKKGSQDKGCPFHFGKEKCMLTTLVLLQVGQDVKTSAVVCYQQRFRGTDCYLAFSFYLQLL